MTHFNRLIAVLLAAAAMLTAETALALDTKDYRFHRMPETSYYGGINSISKDVLGRIWFTGTDALYMFNGISFQQVKPENPTPSVPLNYRSVRVMRDGRLVVATNVGLFKYDYRFQDFNIQIEGGISAIRVDNDDNMWFLHKDILSKLDPSGNLTAYPFSEATLVPANCHCVDGSVFMSSVSNVWKLDTQTGEYSFFANFTGTNPETGISDMVGHDGFIYVLTERNGLFECMPDGNVRRHFDGLPGISKQLFIDTRGVFWIATQNGLQFIDPVSGESKVRQSHLNDSFSLPNDSVWSIFQDGDGEVWVGTYGGKIAYQSFNDDDAGLVHPASGSLNHPIVSAFAEDSEGRLWIGTEGGGINCWDISENKFVELSLKSSSGINYSQVKRLKCIGDKLYIASFHGGISILDRKTSVLSTLSIKDPVSGNPVPCYDFELEGTKGIWISNPDTDFMYWDRASGKVEKVYGTESDGTQSRFRVESFYRTEDGRLVLATHHGVVVMDALTRTVINRYEVQGEDVSLNFLNCFCRISDSETWFGTMGAGVVRLAEDGSYDLLRDADGNPMGNHRIFAIERDIRSGNVWFSTENGLYVYRQSTSQFEKAKIGSSASCGAYYIRSGFVTSAGTILFGGTDGLIAFDPSSVDRNTQKPVVFFNSFRVNNMLMLPGAKDSPLKYSISWYGMPDAKKTSLRLKNNQSNFEVGFACDSYLEASRNTYAYRMVGISDNWIILPPGQQSVRFIDLSAGHYRLEVKAANNVGVWGDTVTSLSVVVTPHFLLSPLAYLIYFLIILCIVWWLWSWSTKRKMLEQQLTLEMEKEKNLQELNQVRNEFFTNISHDLKTPLTLVIDPLKQLEKEIPEDASYRKHVTMIGRNIARIQRMLTQLLQFRQIESVKAPVNAVPGDIVKFVDSVFSLFEFYASKKQIETEFKPWVESYSALFDTEMIEKVFTNLFSNAIKYTSGEGYVGVRIAPSSLEDIPLSADVDPQAQWLTFVVTNTGSEIPESRYKTIFEPFNNEGKTKLEFESHTGLGLAIVQALVTDMKGTISVSSSDNQVSFTVVLPLVPCAEAYESPDISVVEDDSYDYAASEIDAMISEIDEMEGESNSRERKTYDILVIEDDKQLRGYLEQRLSNHYNVYTASNGEDGIAKAARIMPNIIITDLLMPKKNGFEVCRSLRTDMKTSHIPIIALSATGENTNFKIEALESGANVFIDKPVDMDFLLKQVANLIKNQNKLKELYSRRFVAEPSKIASSSVDEELMKKAVAFIEKNFENENYGVEEFVSDMAIARTRLYQKINDLTGMSIKEFILDIRLKRACQLLRESEYTVAEISTMTGFASPKYFSVCFKRHYGQSPTDFKANTDAEKNSK